MDREAETELYGDGTLAADMLAALHAKAAERTGQAVGDMPYIAFACPACRGFVFTCKYHLDARSLALKCANCGRGRVMVLVATSAPEKTP